MLVTVLSASVLVQCHEETLRRRIRKGDLKAVEVAGVQRVDTNDLGVPKTILAGLESAWREALRAAAEKELGL
jgi:hypothetical protein